MKVVFRNVPARSRGFAPSAYSYIRLSTAERLYFKLFPKKFQALVERHPKMRVVESWMSGPRAYGADLTLSV